MAIEVRRERRDDHPAVRDINRAAFQADGEADLVDALRDQVSPVVSLVAADDAEVVGHILFSPVTLAGHDELRIAGLGPMAVSSTRQRSGIGSALLRAGLDACRAQAFVAVVVVGHPGYYPRFGFQPASRFRISCEFDVPDDVFMALELEAGALNGRHGTVHYHPLFATV